MKTAFRLGAKQGFTSTARERFLLLAIVLFIGLQPYPADAKKGKGGRTDPGTGGGGGGGGGAVSTPVENQRLQWQVPLAGPYSAVRPEIGPGGTIYAVDVFDNLFAVAPDGTVKWSAGLAGSKGLAVGQDGTIYTGNEDWIKAFNPDGSVKWTFTPTLRAMVLHDVAVGPDGHVYGVASSGLGVFSLEDLGTKAGLRWTNPEPYERLFVDYTEMAFGPGPRRDGKDTQLYFHVNGHTRAIRLSDGASVFTVSGQNQRPQVSPADGTWHVGYAAYDPDASLVWTFDFGTTSTAREPALGASGNHYAISQGRTMYAIDPGGAEDWVRALDEPAGSPDVDPAETQILVSVGGTSLQPVALKSLGTGNGSTVWRMEIPADPSGLDQFVDTGVAFSANSGTAYVVTALAGGNASFLNAISMDPAIPAASTVLRSSAIVLSSQSNGGSVDLSGVVTVRDESLGPISGATVQATWTLPDGTFATVAATTDGSGQASFQASGDGGIWWLDVTDIVLAGFAFDPAHSLLSAGRAAF